MTIRHLLALCAFALALAASPAGALEWRDDVIRFWWGPSFREPGIATPQGDGKDIAKNVLTYTHVDRYRSGGNFLNVNLLLSSDSDPSNGNADQGATEVYITYRRDLSLSKLTASRTLSRGCQLGVGYEYWLNKFGNDADVVPGSRHSTCFVEAALHL